MRQIINPLAVFYLIIFFLMISCRNEEEKKNEKEKQLVQKIDIRQLPVKNLFSYKRPIDNCRFVALETTDECLIREIDKVSIENNLIFVKDDNDNLFVFSMSGKFLNKIGSIGQSGEELLSFTDFYVNKNSGYVGIFDVLRSKILRFTFDGKYISSHSCAKEMSESYNFISLLGSDLLIGMRNNMNSKYAYITVSENNYSLKKSFFPHSIIGNVSSTPMRYIASHSTNGLYVTTYFSDTIFKFTDKNIPEPILLVKSEQKIATPKILSDINAMDIETAFDANSILRNKGFSVGVSKIYVTDTFLHIDYPMPNYKSANIFYCLKSGKTFKSITDRSDFFGQGWGPAFTTTEQEIVYAIEADRILELNNKPDLFVNSEVLETIKNVEEFDNPVLVFFSSGYGSRDVN